jgi:Fe-S cluster assembly iron-binding protein IscA
VDALTDLGPIRITAEEVDGEIELSIDDATDPTEGDQLVERGGARIFLDAVAADALADQVIGIEAHGDHVHFTFDEQADEPD